MAETRKAAKEEAVTVAEAMKDGQRKMCRLAVYSSTREA